MAIVLLAERNELSYDEPATKWVPELARFRGITLRHLLNHTSGLPDYYENSALEQAATAPNRESYLANGEAIGIYETWGELVSPPGERYEYSNPGYEVLALVVERATGVSFGQFLSTNLFSPLGMSTAVVRNRPAQVILGRDIGYAPDSTSGEWIENDDHWGNSVDSLERQIVTSARRCRIAPGDEGRYVSLTHFRDPRLDDRKIWVVQALISQLGWSPRDGLDLMAAA